MDDSLEIYRRPLVERALRRSYVKRRIVEYLSVHGFSYISQIANHIFVTPTNVIGAIRGMENRYTSGDSLIALGIVTETDAMKDRDDDRIKFYCLTSSWGQEAVKMCKKFNENM